MSFPERHKGRHFAVNAKTFRPRVLPGCVEGAVWPRLGGMQSCLHGGLGDGALEFGFCLLFSVESSLGSDTIIFLFGGIYKVLLGTVTWED